MWKRESPVECANEYYHAVNAGYYGWLLHILIVVDSVHCYGHSRVSKLGEWRLNDSECMCVSRSRR